MTAPVAFDQETQLTRERAALARALDVLFDNATIGLGFFDSELRVVRINARLAEFNGAPIEAHLGRRLDEILPPQQIAVALDYMRRTLSTGEAILGVEIAGEGPRGYGVFQCDYHPVPLPSEQGPLGVAAVVTDVTSERMAARRIAESEAKLRNVLDASLAYVGVITLDGRLSLVNAPALVDAGLSPEDVHGIRLEDTYWFAWDEEVRERTKEAVARALSGETVRWTETLRFGPLERRRLLIQITPVRGPDGQVAYLVPTGADITELAEAQAQQALLTAELNHRVKNVLSIVRALLRQTARRAPTKDALVEALEGRIGAMARSVALLTRANWTGFDLAGIVREQVDFIFGERVTLEGPAAPLTPKAALAFALIGYELMSNAAKYGALSQPGGRVAVAWELRGDRLVWSWREIGGPEVAAPADKGFGSLLLQSVAQGDLDANLHIDFRADGLIVTLDMPRARVERFAPALALDASRPLADRRLLVAEESGIVAMEMVASFEAAGATAIGPFTSAAEAHAALAEAGAVDAAVVAGRFALEQNGLLAHALQARGVPLVAVTGAAELELPSAAQVVQKPFSDLELIEVAVAVIGEARATSAAPPPRPDRS